MYTSYPLLWQFVVATIEYGVRATIYVDGQSQSFNSVNTAYYNSTQPLRIGMLSNSDTLPSPNYNLSGKAAMVFICAAELSAAHVARLRAVTAHLFA